MDPRYYQASYLDPRPCSVVHPSCGSLDHGISTFHSGMRCPGPRGSCCWRQASGLLHGSSAAGILSICPPPSTGGGFQRGGTLVHLDGCWHGCLLRPPEGLWGALTMGCGLSTMQSLTSFINRSSGSGVHEEPQDASADDDGNGTSFHSRACKDECLIISMHS